MKSFVPSPRLLTVIAVAALGAACSNPTVDPASTFEINGRALAADGTPLASTQVKLIRHFDKLKLLAPTVDALFDCTGDCSDSGTGLELAVVKTITTGSDGSFSTTVTGAEIQAKNGLTDSQGKVEVSSLVLVVLDPTDAAKKAGVYSFDQLFSQADKVWSAGSLKLWDSNATADASDAVTRGLVRFSWKGAPVPSGSAVANIYRVEASGTSSARLVVNCADRLLDGDSLMAGEARSTRGVCDLQGDTLYFDVSAYSMYRFYSDRGDFTAYVAAKGVDFRYRSRFTIIAPTFPDPTGGREDVAVAGVWAVSNFTTAGQGEQSLLGTAAVDGNRESKADFTGSPSAIYVSFNQPVYVSDAGLFNAIVADAAGACVEVAFSSAGTPNIGDIKMTGNTWEIVGRFCGATASAREMTAVLGFDSSATASPGRLGKWLRFQLIDDRNVDGTVSPTFSGVYEIGVYGRRAD